MTKTEKAELENAKAEWQKADAAWRVALHHLDQNHEAIKAFVAKIRNPRMWPGATTEIRKLIADELAEQIGEPHE